VSPDELIDAWEAAWSGRDAEAFEPLCAPGFQYEDPVAGEPLAGLDSLRSHARQLWAAFPDARVEKTGERLTDGRYVAAPCKVLGTHRAPLAGLPATRRFVVVHCVFYCEVDRGQLLRVRSFFDLYDAGRQIGVMPARGGLGEKALMLIRGFGLRAGGDEGITERR
jgi:steroid delta-isomerase-like uncharacterized protein